MHAASWREIWPQTTAERSPWQSGPPEQKTPTTPASDADPVSTLRLLLILTSASWKEKTVRSGRNYLPPVGLPTMRLILDDLRRFGPRPDVLPHVPHTALLLTTKRVKYLLRMYANRLQNKQVRHNDWDHIWRAYTLCPRSRIIHYLFIYLFIYSLTR